MQQKRLGKKGIEIMPKKLVIDANFVLALISEEEYSSYAEEIYNLIKSKNIIVYAPTFILVEVLNILIKKKKVNPEFVINSLSRLKKSGIVFLDTDGVIKNSFELEDLVIKYNITSYDALYIMTALKCKCKLLTVDQELLKIKNLTVDLRNFKSESNLS